MLENEQLKSYGARTTTGAVTLLTAVLIGLIGALWEWRRAITADPFHYGDQGSIASGLLNSLFLFVGFALLVWLVSRLLRRDVWAPAILAVAFFYLELLARFAVRGGSVRSLAFILGLTAAFLVAVIVAIGIKRGTGRKAFTAALLFLVPVIGIAIAYESGFARVGGATANRGSASLDRKASPAGAPNLVLITIDTLRPDFLGSYGNPFVHTPHIDRYARKGTQVARALSSIPITLPSHASLFTGTHPSTHGVMNNGIPFDGAEESVLAGHLRAHGYETGAFVAAFPLDAAFGLDRGFDVYNDETGDARLLSGLQLQKLLHESSPGTILKRLGRPVMTHRVAERGCEMVWDSARAWLDERTGAPFFLWLHFYDPHAPYAPGSIESALYEGRTVLRGGLDLDAVAVPAYARLDGANTVDTYRRLYAGEVTRVDRIVGRVEHYFDEQEWTPRTVFALTSDHGEGLGSHDILSHTSRLYDEQLAVPLFLRGPGIERGGLSLAPFRLVDLVPTLLECAGLPELTGVEGRVMKLGREEGSAALSLARDFVHLAETPVNGGRRSLESDGWKLIHALRTGDYELFDRAHDPAEAHDRITERDADTAYRSLRDLLESIPSPLHGGAGTDMSDLPESAREKLRGLGYLTDD